MTSYLEMTRKSDCLASVDEPLGRIILIPLDSVAVVHGELVVEVVVSLTNSGESGEDMVSRSMFVIEGAISEPVRKRINAESGLVTGLGSWDEMKSKNRTHVVNKAQPEDTRIHISTTGIAPK
jgi:hypothetical protein